VRHGAGPGMAAALLINFRWYIDLIRVAHTQFYITVLQINNLYKGLIAHE